MKNTISRLLTLIAYILAIIKFYKNSCRLLAYTAMYLSVTVLTSSHLCGRTQYLSLAVRCWVLQLLVNDPLGLLKGCSISQKADHLFTETNWCLQS